MAIEFARELEERGFELDRTYTALREGERRYTKEGKLDLASVPHPALPRVLQTAREVYTTVLVPFKRYAIVPSEEDDGFTVSYEERNPFAHPVGSDENVLLRKLFGRFSRNGLPLDKDAEEIKGIKERESSVNI